MGVEKGDSGDWVFKYGVPDSLFLEFNEMNTSNQMAASSIALDI